MLEKEPTKLCKFPTLAVKSPPLNIFDGKAPALFLSYCCINLPALFFQPAIPEFCI